MMMVCVESIIFQMTATEKRKAADENHVFQSKVIGKYFCFKDIIICFIYNEKNLFFKKIYSSRHYVISHIL
jgi:hypothetical protein